MKQLYTVLRLFTDAVDQYALPSKVRSDNGRENVDIWHYNIPGKELCLQDHTLIMRGLRDYGVMSLIRWDQYYKRISHFKRG